MANQYGQVFAKAEELDLEDIQQNNLGKKYAKYGLKKYRKVYSLRDRRSQKISAILIANRSPLGLNFSFLENRAYYIVAKELDATERNKVLKSMNTLAKIIYGEFDLQCVPIVTDKESSAVLQNQQASLQREYMQSIWLRAGFKEWYAHIESFLKRIERRG